MHINKIKKILRKRVKGKEQEHQQVSERESVV